MYKVCGKVCKNIHGLKIHRARMKCPLGAQVLHLVRRRRCQARSHPIVAYTRLIKWPAASMTSLWQKFDDDVDQILEGMAKGESDKKLQVMTTTIVSMAVERFDEVEKKSSGTT